MAVVAPGCSSSPGTAPSSVLPSALGADRAAASSLRNGSARAMAVGIARPVCPPATSASGTASCFLLQRTDITSNPTQVLSIASIPGLHPSDLLAAYGLASAASTRGTGQTVGVVVAYANPALAIDVNVYRAAFGIPLCTTLNGCLTFAYHAGVQPATNSAWAAEADLDVEMVSAVCPKCRIVVSEAKSDQIDDLAAAVGAAVSAGATVVSNSYAVPESPALAHDAAAYAVAGVPMTAGAGDTGYGTGVANFPASAPTVTAVGGTTLSMNAGTYAGETVWAGTGSGCSTLFAKPAWQTDTGCALRTVNDVAVVGDPNTGVSAFISGLGGWNVFGGTSVGAPIVASMYALAGGKVTAASLYAHPSLFRAISGSTAACTPAYLCTASSAYNGPAGLGTPNGIGAF